MILILFGHTILYKSTHPTLYAIRFEEVTTGSFSSLSFARDPRDLLFCVPCRCNLPHYARLSCRYRYSKSDRTYYWRAWTSSIRFSSWAVTCCMCWSSRSSWETASSGLRYRRSWFTNTWGTVCVIIFYLVEQHDLWHVIGEARVSIIFQLFVNAFQENMSKQQKHLWLTINGEDCLRWIRDAFYSKTRLVAWC